jgi:hypothetical protein
MVQYLQAISSALPSREMDQPVHLSASGPLNPATEALAASELLQTTESITFASSIPSPTLDEDEPMPASPMSPHPMASDPEAAELLSGYWEALHAVETVYRIDENDFVMQDWDEKNEILSVGYYETQHLYNRLTIARLVYTTIAPPSRKQKLSVVLFACAQSIVQSTIASTVTSSSSTSSICVN